VLWHTDSKTCVSIIEKRSTNDCLNEFDLEIFNVCAKNAITLRGVWLSRNENTFADSLSKMIDYDDNGVKKSSFIMSMHCLVLMMLTVLLMKLIIFCLGKIHWLGLFPLKRLMHFL